MTVHVQGSGQRGDGQQVAAGMRYLTDQIAAPLDLVGKFLFLGEKRVAEGIGVLLKRQVALHDEYAVAGITDTHNVHREGKAV